jgi:hypothetical protein
MDEFDPTLPLLDISIKTDGRVTLSVEQPSLSCPCDGTGWLGREWLYKRESSCTCSVGTDDFVNIPHAVNCDSVPCPFCPGVTAS